MELQGDHGHADCAGYNKNDDHEQVAKRGPHEMRQRAICPGGHGHRTCQGD